MREKAFLAMLVDIFNVGIDIDILIWFLTIAMLVYIFNVGIDIFKKIKL